MTVLSSKEIKNYIEEKKELVIMPIIEPKKQINKASVNLRLGSEFILIKKAEIPSLDLKDSNLNSKIMRFYEEIYVPPGKPFFLHPRELVLGVTLEYIKMPLDLIGYLFGRSTWGRLGLIIATATLIHPGSKGCITLEITNVGNVPISLYPGWPIAQLTLHKLSEKERIEYQGKYCTTPEECGVGPTKPEFCKIEKEIEENKFLLFNDIP